MSGFPELNGSTLAEQRDDLALRFGDLARQLVDEPRGNEAMVGALLLPPVEPGSLASVIFFDRSGPLGMCGHGTIGVIETLRHLGELSPGPQVIDTAVGSVTAELQTDGAVSVANVPSWRIEKAATIEVDGIGQVTGDVAYGGNTFFLVKNPEFDLNDPRAELLRITTRILEATHAAGFGDVDHVELFGPATQPDANSRSFVLCPSGTFDRSPCGTGTSAKIACLAADGLLDPGEPWIQESITGSVFTATYSHQDDLPDVISPVITGRAEIIAESELLFRPGTIRPGSPAP